MTRLTHFLAGLVLITVATAVTADSAYITLNGHRLHYLDRGTGSAVVLVHGLGADVSRWQPTIAALAPQHRVIAPDLLGFGRSDKPAIAYRGQVFVDQLVALLDSLGVQRVTLVGNSMGGWISLLMAEQYPERVERLVLVAPAFVFGLPDGITADQLTAGANPQTLVQMRAYLDRVYHQPPTDLETIRTTLQSSLTNNTGEAIASVARSLAANQDVFSDARLAAMTTPTLIIHGDADGVVPAAASRQLVTLLPNARLEIITDAGHWPQLEQPQQFNALLLR